MIFKEIILLKINKQNFSIILKINLIKDSDNNGNNDENKSDDVMDIFIYSFNNLEIGEEEEIITLSNNDNNNVNINNNLIDYS